MGLMTTKMLYAQPTVGYTQASPAPERFIPNEVILKTVFS